VVRQGDDGRVEPVAPHHFQQARLAVSAGGDGEHP
jgi:hypothetical protein